MGGGGVLGTLSDVVIVVALVVAVVIGALFVGGRIASRAENKTLRSIVRSFRVGTVVRGDGRSPFVALLQIADA